MLAYGLSMSSISIGSSFLNGCSRTSPRMSSRQEIWPCRSGIARYTSSSLQNVAFRKVAPDVHAAHQRVEVLNLLDRRNALLCARRAAHLLGLYGTP